MPQGKEKRLDVRSWAADELAKMRHQKFSERPSKHCESRCRLVAIFLRAKFLLRRQANAERFDGQSKGSDRRNLAPDESVGGGGILAC